MSKEEIEDILEELHLVRPEILAPKAKKLFEAIMSIADERDKFQQENQELKKQLEEKTKIGISDHKYASKCEDKVITIENQQKEFIKYLENKRDEYAENLEYWSSELINIILSKYKSVIGVSDEKEN